MKNEFSISSLLENGWKLNDDGSWEKTIGEEPK